MTYNAKQFATDHVERRTYIFSNETLFLIYFLLIYFLKLLNITAENVLLQVVSVLAICFAFVLFTRHRYTFRELITWIILFVIFVLITLCSHKEGALLSLITIFSFKNLNQKKLYSKIFFVGIFGVLISMIIEFDGEASNRFIGGEWVTIYKRSNILFIAFYTLIALYVLIKRGRISFKELVIIGILSFLMYQYTGSRTGILIATVFIVLALIFRIKCIRRSKIVYFLIMLLPIGCFFVSVLFSVLYPSNGFVQTLDLIVQGRFRLGNLFLNTYTPQLFGQAIVESVDPNAFMVLDNAYLDMLLAYGVLFSITWICVSTFVIRFLYKRGRMVEIALVCSYLIYGISETFLPNCFLNISLFLYAEYIHSLIYRRIILQRSNI